MNSAAVFLIIISEELIELSGLAESLVPRLYSVLKSALSDPCSEAGIEEQAEKEDGESWWRPHPALGCGLTVSATWPDRRGWTGKVLHNNHYAQIVCPH